MGMCGGIGGGGGGGGIGFISILLKLLLFLIAIDLFMLLLMLHWSFDDELFLDDLAMDVVANERDDIADVLDIELESKYLDGYLIWCCFWFDEVKVFF